MFIVLLLILLLFLALMGYLLERRHRHRQKQALIRNLYAWADHAPTLDPDLQRWIQRLPFAEATVLVNLLSDYCASLNWELTWLFGSQIERAPVLKQAIEESVSDYARAILTALQLEPDVQAFLAYAEFARKPGARKQRRLVTKLYPKIEAEGIAATENPARKWGFLPRSFAQGDKKRKKTPSYKEQVRLIQQAFEQDPARTMEVLKRTLIREAADAIA